MQLLFSGGPYCAFAGHDASRALATFSVNNVKDTDDDLSDLSSMEMDSVREWEIQFNGKQHLYDFYYAKTRILLLYHSSFQHCLLSFAIFPNFFCSLI